jgi:hypothetical protein
MVPIPCRRFSPLTCHTRSTSHRVALAAHRCLDSGTGLGRTLDQGAHACTPWSSATLRSPPALLLLGRLPAGSVTPLPVADPVGPHRRVMEQGGALRRRVPLGKPFEGVEEDVVGERHLIHREVTFKHAAVRA